MAGLVFGTGGTPHSAKSPSTIDGIERIAELGLGCMEIEFVQGVKMNQESAILVGEIADKKGIKLSAHAPYFINLNAHEPEKIKASQDRLLQTASIASLCHAESIVFHAAFYLGDLPEKVYDRVKRCLQQILNYLERENNRVWIRPEITGKPSQFGSLEEIVGLSTELRGIAPCLDFAHWHARTGEFNSYSEFASVLQLVKDRLGRNALDNMHVHVSGIDYGKKGETKHLNLKESDFRYAELLKALKDYDAKGIVICESPNLEEDALLLQATYNTL
ncbi:TIM barrel protein [Dehalococcoidales bacterium]|nr:TIM barrel protein [Dehalococcoidales bacterium]MCL0057776.1 TIM barrel protein [Dehalococcoidales bacterium]